MSKSYEDTERWGGGVRLEQDRRLMEAKAGERHDRKRRG